MFLSGESGKKVPKGLFITFEGGEGSGKSIQCTRLFERLQVSQKANGRPLLKTREPGGSPSAELIRPLLLTGDKDRWLPVSEALLFYAARYDHWRRVILPVLEKGGIVLCDRFFDSSRVYQGIGRQLPSTFFDTLHMLFEQTGLPAASPHAFQPDRTYILDIEPRIGLERSNLRQKTVSLLQKENRFEQIDLAFHEKVRQGYITLAQVEPKRCRLIPADQPIEALHEILWEDLQNYL